ncbi:MAG: hypothetical protein NTX40_11360 [Planctomycetota bacterium]|nr:hypothetical protein [Planctomycetota bacterium]
MSRVLRIGAVVALFSALLSVSGCAPQALEQCQRLQLAAMHQYRDEMAAYHAKASAQLLAEKRARLDVAVEASLSQAADGGGRVPLATVMEKVRKRAALEDEVRANLAHLDVEFGQRQAAFGRAIELGEEALDLVAEYGRLAALVRGLFVREPEAEQAMGEYAAQRSESDGGSGSEIGTGGD